MILTLTSALSLFLLIALSTVVFFASKKFRFPYTVLLVLVGLLLVPVVNLPGLRHIFGFIDDLVLTPELLFYIFLPVLIFESGFNMNMRKMLDSAWAISLLAVVSLLISALLVATLLYFLMPMIGIELPFIVALLFGAIISPTDPVAVLSLFKECGVPRRLALIFEGESLMNDGTAMALFLVVLSVALEGYKGFTTAFHGVLDFTAMIILGIGLGLAMAAMFSKALNYTRKNDFVTVTLLLISAHLVFITSELINHSGVIHVSSIIATTVAALFLGNYSRSVLKPSVDEYLGKLIEHMAFVVNSLVFLMAGLLFASSGVDFAHLWLPILMTVLVVAAGRVISVYAVTIPLNRTKLENPIPASWSKLLAWASLRGALSIIIVLLIPADYQVAGWGLEYSVRDFLLALTIGCILSTLFIKAPLITPIMNHLNINLPDPLKDAQEIDLGLYCLRVERARLQKIVNEGGVMTPHYQGLIGKLETRIGEAEARRATIAETYGPALFEQSLHLFMVRIEKNVARNLLNNGEIEEPTYRKIYSRLSLQQEKIETAQHNLINPKDYTDRKDIFDRLVARVEAPFRKTTPEDAVRQRMAYYRGQMIMARKAVETLSDMQTKCGDPVFLAEPYEKVISCYRHYQERNAVKFDAIVTERSDLLSPYISQLSGRALARTGQKELAHLAHRGLIDEATEEGLEHQYTAV